MNEIYFRVSCHKSDKSLKLSHNCVMSPTTNNNWFILWGPINSNMMLSWPPPVPAWHTPYQDTLHWHFTWASTLDFGKGWTQQSNLIEIAILREHRDHGPSPVCSAGDTRPGYYKLWLGSRPGTRRRFVSNYDWHARVMIYIDGSGCTKQFYVLSRDARPGLGWNLTIGLIKL